MTTDSATEITGAGLTFGSIVKIGLVEWAACEVLILAFLLLRGASKNGFAIELNGGTLAASGNPVGDFVALSVIAFVAVAALSLCLFLGQQVLGQLLPLNLRLVTRA